MAPRKRVASRVYTNPAPQTFSPGDVVRLKSGGFKMTIVRIIDTCAENQAVAEVIYAKDHGPWMELKTETLPPAVLTLDLDLDTDIPF